MTEVTQPGIYDIPEDSYHRDPVPAGSLSSSGARRLLDSTPAKFRYEQLNGGRPNKREFDFGHAAHREVLGVGADLVIVDAKDWRTKAAKEQRDAAYDDGQTPILAREFEQVVAMAEQIRAHPIASALFDPDKGDPERSAFWQDHRTGIWCRARFDWLPHPSDGRVIVGDYKTSTTADPQAFSKTAANFGYHIQAAWYLDGLRALGYADDPAFVFVIQEKDPPYLVSVAELDHKALKLGALKCQQARGIYRDCVELDDWPGYHPDVHLVSLPAWFHNQQEMYA